MTTDTFQIRTMRKQENRIEASVQRGEQIHQVFFESDDFDLSPRWETMVALALFPCMKTGCDLQVNGGLSPRVLGAIPHIQEVHQCWYPAYRRIQLGNVQPLPVPPVNARRVSLFFSGGLDCWYSLLKHQSEITDLVFVWGLDIPLDNQVLYEKALASVQKVAQGFDKHLIVIRTNLRQFTDSYINWNKIHGTGLAGIAQMLAGEVCKVYIAGGHSYKATVPAGSHVLVDPYWSTESMEIIYDGMELSRVGKAQVVGLNELAMQTLRVCWANLDNDYNCGRCEKCLRTMVNLQIAGALERCTVFAVPLSLKRLSKLTFFDQGDLIYLEENTRAAQKQPHNRKLFRTLQRVLNRFYLLDFLRKVRSNYPHLLPNLSGVKKRLRRVRLK
jgi:hypothetical protein